MKVLAIGILAFVAAVQARSAGLENVQGTALSTVDSPWVVHLRIATSLSSGRLNTCVGSLVSHRYVLTASSCIDVTRFIWIRYGAVNVINPELVTETSLVRWNRDVGLVAINRVVGFTPTIRAVQLAGEEDELPETGTFCGYGAGPDYTPGERLSCSEWSLEYLDDDTFEGSSESAQATRFDLGAPLVKDGVQYGVLVRVPSYGGNAVFASTAAYRRWIDAELPKL